MLSLRGLGLIPVSVVVGLVGVAYGVEEFVLVAVAGAMLLALGALTLVWQVGQAQSALRIDVRRPPGEISVDTQAWLVLEGRNSGRRPVPGLWLEGPRRWTVSHPGMLTRRLSPPVPVAPPASGRWAGLRHVHGFDRPSGWQAVPALASGARWQVPIGVPTESWGLWTLGQVGVWCADPLGLMRWKVTSSAPGQVVVLPRPVAGTEHRPGEREQHGSRLGAATIESPVQAGAGGDEFSGIRPYEPGDRLTRLHWPALARNGDLLTRDFVELEERRVQVLVDTRPWKVDTSVSAAAAAGISALAGGATVELRTTSGEQAVVVPGPAASSVLLFSLALVSPSAFNPDGTVGVSFPTVAPSPATGGRIA